MIFCTIKNRMRKSIESPVDVLDRLITYLECLITSRAVHLRFGPTLTDREIGLGSLEDNLHWVHHCWHISDLARQTPSCIRLMTQAGGHQN